MRVSSVCLAVSRPTHKINVSAKLNNPNTKIAQDVFEKTNTASVSFGRSVKWGGVFGVIAGTLAGVALTAATGGAAACTIPYFAGGGGMAGDAIDASISDDYPNSGDIYDGSDSYGAEYYY